MLKVKPDKSFEVMVVHHRPYRRFFYCFVFFFIVFFAACGGFIVGHQYAINEVSRSDVAAELRVLKARYAEKIKEAEKLDQQLSYLSLMKDIDSKANETVRATIVRMKETVAKLEQDNTFYRSLMHPRADHKGVVIDQPDIAIGSVFNLYKYTFVIKQVVTQHRELSGYIQIELLGRQDGEFRRLKLSNISNTMTVERLQLKFKYFQRIDGEMLLPEGFLPQRIVLKAVIQQPKKVVVDKEFDWLINES